MRMPVLTLLAAAIALTGCAATLDLRAATDPGTALVRYQGAAGLEACRPEGWLVQVSEEGVRFTAGTESGAPALYVTVVEPILGLSGEEIARELHAFERERYAGSPSAARFTTEVLPPTTVDGREALVLRVVRTALGEKAPYHALIADTGTVTRAYRIEMRTAASSPEWERLFTRVLACAKLP